MNKRVIILAAVLLLSLTACGQNSRALLSQSSSGSLTVSASDISPDSPSSYTTEENFNQMPDYLPQESLNQKEQFYYNLSQSLYLIKFHKEESLTDKEKAAFFQWVIANKQYEKRCESWWDSQNKAYRIPLSDMKNIIFTHLDTDEFDPKKAFSDARRTNDGAPLVEYDAATETLTLYMIGGFGGAAAFEVLDIDYQDDTIAIQLGIFEMESFYASPQEHMLKERYSVVFQDNPQEIEKFKILCAKKI